jgi:hypothetical protein
MAQAVSFDYGTGEAMRLPAIRSLLALGLVWSVAGPPSPAHAQPADLVIRQGRLISMASEVPEVVPIKGLVIRGGRIERIVRLDQPDALPPAARTIDAGTSFIVPGLIDAHVHFRPWFPDIFLHYGVTTLMDTGPCGADCREDPNEWILRFKRDLNSGTRRGPSLYITGMKLGGPEDAAERHTWILQSLDDVSQKLALLAGLGVDALKTEPMLPAEFRRRIVEEGARRNLPVVGHSKDARQSISVGMRFIEHMYPIAFSLSGDPAALVRGNEYLMDLTRADPLIDLMVSREVYLNPTLLGGFAAVSPRIAAYATEDATLLTQATFAAVPAAERKQITERLASAGALPAEKRSRLQESYRKVQEFIRRLHGKGGWILAASDASDGTLPGLATHREMQLLVDAGLPPYTALLGATRRAAELMRKEDVIGTIAPGKQADVVILSANPIEDIAATQEIEYVIRKGKVEREPGAAAAPAVRVRILRPARTAGAARGAGEGSFRTVISESRR